MEHREDYEKYISKDEIRRFIDGHRFTEEDVRELNRRIGKALQAPLFSAKG